MLRHCYFECSECNTKYEDLLEKPYGVWPWEPEEACPECGALNKQTLAPTNIGAFSAMTREQQMDSLKKRSVDHSKKQNTRNADEIHAKWNSGRGAKING